MVATKDYHAAHEDGALSTLSSTTFAVKYLLDLTTNFLGGHRETKTKDELQLTLVKSIISSTPGGMMNFPTANGSMSSQSTIQGKF